MVENNQYPVRYPEFAARLNEAMARRQLDIPAIVQFFKLHDKKITYEMVRRYTMGTAIPRLANAETLALAVGVPVSTLIYGAEKGNHKTGPGDASINATKNPLIAPSLSNSSNILDAANLTSQQRLKAALSSLSVTAEVLAGVVGVGSEIAALWLNGDGPEISLEQAVALQNTYGINSVWLIKGKGDPGVAVRYNDEFRPRPIIGSKVIPVVGMAQLGDNGHWSDLEYPVGHGAGYVDFPSRDPNAYALKCEGDSMSPRIEAGEFVICEPNMEVKPGKNVLVKSKDGRVMVKKFLYRAAGRIYLISVNQAHPPISFHDDEIERMHFIRAIVDADSWIPDIPTAF
jgi:hypothetical protein